MAWFYKISCGQEYLLIFVAVLLESGYENSVLLELIAVAGYYFLSCMLIYP
jgi:hypothetical protein